MEQFKSQCDAYIKFLSIHFVIVFTIVFSLISAILQIDNDEIKSKVNEIRSLISKSEELPHVNDYFIEKMYMEDIRNTARESIKDTATISTTTIDTGKTIQIKNTTAISDPVERINKIEKLVHDIVTISNNAFKLKISFLGDITVDLRYWIFVLPLFLIFSAIYIFILDYKIILLKETQPGEIGENQKHPFNFLRNLFLVLEVFLVAAYVVVLVKFLNYGYMGFKNQILMVYFFFIYYSLIYCLFIKSKLKTDAYKGNPTPDFLGRMLTYFKKSGTEFLIFFRANRRHSLLIGTTQVLLISTLFLSMSYQQCSESGSGNMKAQPTVELNDTAANREISKQNIQPKEENSQVEKRSDFIKGYELMTTPKTWIDVPPGAFQFYDQVNSYILKYSYIAVILITLFLSIYYFKKEIKKQDKRFSVSRLLFCISIIMVTYFSVYFGLVNVAYIDILVSLIILLYWYFVTVKRIAKGNAENRQFKIISTLVIYLFPFIIASFINCIVNSDELTGWIFFYIGLWFLIITSTIIYNYKTS